MTHTSHVIRLYLFRQCIECKHRLTEQEPEHRDQRHGGNAFEPVSYTHLDVYKRQILIPDSFKGTFSSEEICRMMAETIERHAPHALISKIPVADGGEGSVDAFLTAVGGEKIEQVVQGPFGRDIDSFFGILPDQTGVVEMAAAAGLPLVGDRRDVANTTTYGCLLYTSRESLRHVAGSKR